MKYRCLSHSRRGRGNKSSGLQNIKRQLYCLFLDSKHAHARIKVSPRVRAYCVHGKTLSNVANVASANAHKQNRARIATRSDFAAPKRRGKVRMKIANRRSLPSYRVFFPRRRKRVRFQRRR